MTALCALLLLDRPLRILPLGDSITQGGRASRPEFTYRLPLYRLLKDAKVSFQFVGSLTTGLEGAAEWPKPFDPHHEGHYGWKTAAVRDHLEEWSKSWSAPPDIALIHLGTNDQSGDPEKDVVQPLSDIIGTLRKINPHVVVLVGHLNFNGGAAIQIRPAVNRMVKALDHADSRVVAVNHFEGWVEDPSKPDADTFDWAHPNPQGQAKMARRWFDAMKPFLKLQD